MSRLRIGLAFALACALAPREASACSELAFALELILPAAADVPLNGVLFGLVDAPYLELEQDVSLTDVEGNQIPIEVSVERNVNHEQAIVRARPLAPLEPNTAYVWWVAGDQRSFTTGDALDEQAPSFGEIATQESGSGTVTPCFGQPIPYSEYRVEVSDVDEAVVTLLLATAEGDDEYLSASAAFDEPATKRVLNPSSGPCVEVIIVDQGGTSVNVGETAACGAPDEGTSSSEGEGGEPGLGGDEVIGGCACRAQGPTPRRLALSWLVIVGLGLGGIQRRGTPRGRTRDKRGTA